MVARTKSHGFSEQKYVLDRMEKRGMLGAKPMKPLMDPTVKLFILDHLEKRGMLGVNPNETSDGSYCKLFLHKEQLYDYPRVRTVGGGTTYYHQTRYFICGELCLVLSSKIPHKEAAILLRYLKNSADCGLLYHIIFSNCWFSGLLLPWIIN